MKEQQYILGSSIGYLIFMINQRMYGYFRKKLDKEGVNVIETWILWQILNGVKTGNELTIILKVDAALIHRSCNRLIKKKWIMRSINPIDRRVKFLALTEKGNSLIKRLMAHSKETNFKALSSLTEEQKNSLRQTLQSILNGPFFEEVKIK